MAEPAPDQDRADPARHDAVAVERHRDAAQASARRALGRDRRAVHPGARAPRRSQRDRAVADAGVAVVRDRDRVVAGLHGVAVRRHQRVAVERGGPIVQLAAPEERVAGDQPQRGQRSGAVLVEHLGRAPRHAAPGGGKVLAGQAPPSVVDLDVRHLRGRADDHCLADEGVVEQAGDHVARGGGVAQRQLDQRARGDEAGFVGDRVPERRHADGLGERD